MQDCGLDSGDDVSMSDNNNNNNGGSGSGFGAGVVVGGIIAVGAGVVLTAVGCPAGPALIEGGAVAIGAGSGSDAGSALS